MCQFRTLFALVVVKLMMHAMDSLVEKMQGETIQYDLAREICKVEEKSYIGFIVVVARHPLDDLVV